MSLILVSVHLSQWGMSLSVAAPTNGKHPLWPHESGRLGFQLHQAVQLISSTALEQIFPAEHTDSNTLVIKITARPWKGSYLQKSHENASLDLSCEQHGAWSRVKLMEQQTVMCITYLDKYYWRQLWDICIFHQVACVWSTAGETVHTGKQTGSTCAVV